LEGEGVGAVESGRGGFGFGFLGAAGGAAGWWAAVVVVFRGLEVVVIGNDVVRCVYDRCGWHGVCARE